MSGLRHSESKEYAMFARAEVNKALLYFVQIAERNRGCYRKLRTELESLTESGICLNKKLVMTGASVMQRLTVEMLCNQLDNTWKYFTATFKMQVCGHYAVSSVMGFL